MLSSYYYAKLEEDNLMKKVKDFKQQGKLLTIMRLTDDYIIISNDMNVVKSIVDSLF